MRDDSQMFGFRRFMRMLEGISKKTYGTKKMVRAVLYWLPVNSRSFASLKDLALAILTLSKKAKRYKIHLKRLELDFKVLD